MKLLQDIQVLLQLQFNHFDFGVNQVDLALVKDKDIAFAGLKAGFLGLQHSPIFDHQFFLQDQEIPVKVVLLQASFQFLPQACSGPFQLPLAGGYVEFLSFNAGSFASQKEGNIQVNPRELTAACDVIGRGGTRQRG